MDPGENLPSKFRVGEKAVSSVGSVGITPVCSPASELSSLPWTLVLATKYVDLKQKVSQIIFQQTGCVWEQQRIAVQSRQLWRATFKSTKIMERTLREGKGKLGGHRKQSSSCWASQSRNRARAPPIGPSQFQSRLRSTLLIFTNYLVHFK